MGKIILTVEGTTVGTVASGGGIVIEKTVSEQDSGRLIQAYAHSYAGKWKDENGNNRAPTITEVLEAWFDGIVSGSVAHVESVEKELAAKAAAAAVAPIVVT
jgi:hypothetical protein